MIDAIVLVIGMSAFGVACWVIREEIGDRTSDE